MNDSRKYVIQSGIYPFVFSGATKHSEACPHGGTSAGFFSVNASATRKKQWSEEPYLEVSCWGESLSLNLKSDPEHDKIMLEMLFNGD